ncbi:RTC4-like domain-containing protein [Rhexocercosporidium sp. MPI-PUGE-AT-0058]|nr:RTC4-like domain-containing protein [Rhexocercosporidium sp. MPI-PUGE-AT-0058]
MSISTAKLDLGSTQQRRIGLTRGGYKYPSLLQSLNASTDKSSAPMAPKSAAKRPADVKKSSAKEDSDEDIGRLPDSSSESGEDPSDIKGTDYSRGSSKTEEPATQGKLYPSRNGTATVSGGTKNKVAGTRTDTRNPKLVPNSSNSSIGSTISSTKRKTGEQPIKLGAGMSMTDAFGFPVRPVKKAKNTYGNPKILVSKKKEKEKLKVYSQIEDSPQKSDSAERLKLVPEIVTSPESTPKKVSRLRQPADLGFTPTPTKNEQKSLKNYDMDNLSDSDDELAKQSTNKLRLPQLDESPTKPTEGLRAYTIDLGTNLLSTAKSIIDKNRDELAPISQDMEEYDFQSMTQRACCPMCGATVDPEDIRAYSKSGVMNIRTQERFCRAHKIKTAQDDWEIKDYPTIDWDKLDSRISKHHTFIKKLINGQDSHYRELWGENIEAGKDRSLRKMTSNLTPGYYGARGLRIFSENIMQKFTPLLKKRAPQDSLISARGFAAYVQSVLVPEVAVRLIMEDMRIDVEEGREVLATSVDVGELLNDEIGDVVTRNVVDSEGEDESD